MKIQLNYISSAGLCLLNSRSACESYRKFAKTCICSGHVTEYCVNAMVLRTSCRRTATSALTQYDTLFILQNAKFRLLTQKSLVELHMFLDYTALWCSFMDRNFN